MIHLELFGPRSEVRYLPSESKPSHLKHREERRWTGRLQDLIRKISPGAERIERRGISWISLHLKRESVNRILEEQLREIVNGQEQSVPRIRSYLILHDNPMHAIQ